MNLQRLTLVVTPVTNPSISSRPGGALTLVMEGRGDRGEDIGVYDSHWPVAPVGRCARAIPIPSVVRMNVYWKMPRLNPFRHAEHDSSARCGTPGSTVRSH